MPLLAALAHCQLRTAEQLVLYLGLFFYIQLARTGYLVLLVITTLASFFWGFSILTAYETAIHDMLVMLDGAIIVMAYLTPVSNNFSNDS